MTENIKIIDGNTPITRKFVRELRLASYYVESCGPWYSHDGMYLPHNICTKAADVLEWAINRIAVLEAELEEANLEIERLARRRR